MADDRNPFERLFDPSGGNSPATEFLGTIGRAMGVPTQQERFGEAQGGAMQQLSTIQSQGNLTPQQTILRYMQTPEGQKLFQSGDPRAMDVLRQWGQMVQQPTPQISSVGPGSTGFATTPGQVQNLGQTPNAPTTTNVPQGSQLYSNAPGMGQIGANPAMPQVQGVGAGSQPYQITPNGVTPLARNPTENMQNADYWQGLAKVPAAQMQEIAQWQLTPQDQRPDQKERAIADMVKNNQIDPVIGQKLIAGILQVKPVMNAAGENTGFIQIIDLSQPNPQTGAPNVSVVKPTVNQGEQGAVTPTPENPKGIKDPNKLSMFLGSGLWPTSLSYLQQGAQNLISPNIDVTEGKGQQAQQRQQQIDDLKFALTLFPEGDGKTNIVIKEAQGLIKTGVMSDPLTATRSGIRLYDMAKRELDVDTKMNIGNTTKDEVQRAARRIQGWSNILRVLPERDDMVALERSILDGTSGVPTAATAPGILMRGTVNAVRQGYNQGTGKPNSLEPPAQTTQPQAPAPVQQQQPQGGDTTQQPQKKTEVPAPREAVGAANIESMPVAKILQLDPANLSPTEHAALRKRIQLIRDQRAKSTRIEH